MIQISKHPVLVFPTPEEAMQLGEAGFLKVMQRRSEIIAQEQDDPLRFGWEPPIWEVCDALLGFPWIDQDVAEDYRKALGFERPVDLLLINGGNRGGKSEYAAKRVMRTLLHSENARAWCFHSSNQNSIEYQHPLMWKYLPAEIRRQIKSAVAYISYNQKNGFSDNKFVIPNSSECSFRNYEQEVTKIEGGEINIGWPDELVPPDWIDTLTLRLATRGGKMIVSFTPINGYTPTVEMFQGGAEIVRESTAFLCPKDGGEPDYVRALGFDDDAAYNLAQRVGPYSIPENCRKWIEGERSQPSVPEGRKFETVPRVMKCVEPNKAVVFFHSNDNPYGNPEKVIEMVTGKSIYYVRERYYGVANKSVSAMFPKFNAKVHIVSPKDIPQRGTNYLVVDPGGRKNFFMAWFRVLPEEVFAVREWPGSYEIPGHGVPGPWALPSGKKNERDGKPGPAQDSFGFGLIQYKREIARLEVWKDALKECPSDITQRDFVISWDEENGAEEKIEERFMDSRFASALKLENDRPITLIEEFADIGLHFRPTPGDDISEGVAIVNDWLDYDENSPISYFNKPRLRVSSECRNIIYALQNWTGADGQKGACKDPADVVRYFALCGAEYIDESIRIEQP